MRRPVEAPLGRVLLVGALIAFTGCDRPAVAIVCHNANCVRPFDPSRDDTRLALEESLALKHEGKPVIDGVEIDLLWSADAQACFFAHDHAQPDPESSDLAAEVLVAHLAGTQAITSGGGPFILKLDLKPEVDSSGTRHSRVDLDEHVACALDVFLRLRDAAQRGGRQLATYFDSASPELLSALAKHAAWPTLPAPGIEVKLSAAFAVPGVTSAALADFGVALDAVSLHPDWISSAQRDALSARGVELTLWSHSLGPRQLRILADLEPRFISTSDAVRLRRWLGP